MARPPLPSAPASATRNTAWPGEVLFMLNLMVQVVARPRPQAGTCPGCRLGDSPSQTFDSGGPWRRDSSSRRRARAAPPRRTSPAMVVALANGVGDVRWGTCRRSADTSPQPIIGRRRPYRTCRRCDRDYADFPDLLAVSDRLPRRVCPDSGSCPSYRFDGDVGLGVLTEHSVRQETPWSVSGAGTDVGDGEFGRPRRRRSRTDSNSHRAPR